MDLYDDAFLYDLVHGPLATGKIRQFFIDAAAEYGSPVLELACGTGNILIPVAESGADIHGLDISQKMLSTCRRKASDLALDVRVGKGDIRDFDLGRQFSLIYIAGNSLPAYRHYCQRSRSASNASSGIFRRADGSW